MSSFLIGTLGGAYLGLKYGEVTNNRSEQDVLALMGAGAMVGGAIDPVARLVYAVATALFSLGSQVSGKGLALVRAHPYIAGGAALLWVLAALKIWRSGKSGKPQAQIFADATGVRYQASPKDKESPFPRSGLSQID